MNQPFTLVGGLGKTGHSIAGYLQRRNLPFAIFDTRAEAPGVDEFKRDFPGIEIFLGELPPHLFAQVQEVIVSPGIDLAEPFLQEAYRRAIPVMGDIECFARTVRAPIIAITGTNGKSTVTTLVGKMAEQAGLVTAVAGNIGTPVLDLVDSGQHYDLWVLELSSFQLDIVYSLAPIAATILNISPDHLDRHHDMAAYIAAKQRIYERAEALIYNRDDAATTPSQNPINPSLLSGFSLDAPTSPQDWGIIHHDNVDYLAQGNEALIATNKLALQGKHNWQNALAACALARAAGIDTAAIIQVLQTFSGLPHRCQWVKNINGVDYINDSKGTNIGATISAIAGVGGSSSGKIILIAGGLGKGADFTELQGVVSDYVRATVLIGADAPKIAEALVDVTPITHAPSLANAVISAKSQAMPGDIVLLSPACASLDMFRDFNHRGEEFVKLVEAL